MASEQELADMEKLSSEYVPEARGPLVGHQQSTKALVTEYAEADPVYVHKTLALPAKFSHYRTVKGDGNCGWRALAFGYFETLLRLGEPAKVQAEITRLRSCNAMLDAVGVTSNIYEDFTDQTFALLEKLAANLPNHDNGASLLADFNDYMLQSGITFHFRLLTSAWMKMYPHVYAGFLADMDVATYCDRNILLASIELDHLGLQCLATSVINEAGIAIEVLYLDRSEGEEVNTHKFPVLNGEGHVVDGAPTIRLLYRPGHYDLLYKSEDVIDTIPGDLRNPEVRRVSEPVYDHFSNIAFSQTEELSAYMADLPGFTLSTPAPAFSTSLYPSPHPSATLQGVSSATTGLSIPLAGSSLNPTTIDSTPHSNQSTPPSSSENTPQTRFRGSPYQYEYQERHANLRFQQAQAGVTGGNFDLTKKEDPAHFTNGAFQPQIWQPGSDYDIDTPGKSSS